VEDRYYKTQRREKMVLIGTDGIDGPGFTVKRGAQPGPE